ncbi:MAG: PDZ domain-containing protein [Planctomycetota bacterium]
MDLRAAVVGFFGPTASVKLDELVKTELAIVADSWAEVGSAVWLMRATDPDLLDRWFPKDKRVGEGARRGVQSFRTRDGLRVFIRDDIVAMARRAGAGSLLSKTARLLATQGAGALERVPGYYELAAYLPGNALAEAYFSGGASSPAVESASGWTWLGIECAAAGMYERSGNLEFAICARRARPSGKKPLSLEAFGRFLRLPRSTLAATMMTVDFQRAFEAALEDPTSARLGRYLGLLVGFGTDGMSTAELLSRLGPQVIVTWGPNLSDQAVTPQVAVMIECADARSISPEIASIARNIGRLVAAAANVDPQGGPTVKKDAHLGTPISYLALGDYAQSLHLPAADLIEGIEPAWAAWGGWLILASSREHIHQVLDAQHGLAPNLASVADIRDVNYYRERRTALTFVQGVLASVALDQWAEGHERGRPSLLDSSWWEPRQRIEAGIRHQLGVVLADEQPPGAVAITRVLPDTPAAGVLEEGDRILGVDGALLQIQASASDLSTRLARGGDHTLRVERDNTMLDLPIAQLPRQLSAYARRASPERAVRELAELGRVLQFATFSVHATREDDYSALLSLRFSPAAALASD